MVSNYNRFRRRREHHYVRNFFIVGAVIALGVGIYYWLSKPEQEEISVATAPEEEIWEEHLPDAKDSLLASQIDALVRTTPRIDTTGMAIYVYDLQQHATVYAFHPKKKMIPASCTKMLTAMTAMYGLGVNHQLETRLYTTGTQVNDTLKGDLVLCADDDPLILSLDSLADLVKAQGIKEITGSVIVDGVRPDTLRQHATAMPGDIQFGRLPILMRGQAYVEKEWSRCLTKSGIHVGTTTIGTRQAIIQNAIEKGTVVASVTHPLEDILRPMLMNSDNIAGETLLYHLRHLHTRWPGDGREGGPVSSDSLILKEMKFEGAEYVVNDGSGLSHKNLMTTNFLTQLLIYGYRHPDMWSLLKDKTMATPGERPGTLKSRMRDDIYQGRVFCKTGTLISIGVSSLCGYAWGIDGRWYAFAIMHNNAEHIEECVLLQDNLCKILVTQ